VALTARAATTPLRAEASVRALYLAQAPGLRQAMHRLAGGRLDADDLLQDVFVVALRRASSLAAAESPTAWLYGVAAKVVSGRLRAAHWKRWLGLESAAHVSSGDTPQLSLEQREAQRTVERGLEKLSLAKREVLVLFELQGLSGAEVAQALRIPVTTVWTRLFYARRDFAIAIKETEHD
jgi:RNA polymerase sigma-70 factor (ECF subfamily)